MVKQTTTLGFHENCRMLCCGRFEYKKKLSCCNTGCLEGRAVCIVVFLVSTLLIIGVIVELIYRLYQSIKYCFCNGQEKQKKIAKANVLDLSLSLLISPFAAISVMIRSIVGCLIHPAVILKP